MQQGPWLLWTPEQVRKNASSLIKVKGSVSADMRAKIVGMVDRYLTMLSPRFVIRWMFQAPLIQIRNTRGTGWHGRTLWKSAKPDTTIIELQRSILEHDVTLERVIAHEVIHHVLMASGLNTLSGPAFDEEWETGGHGPYFKKAAAYVNAQVGPNWVTVTSDEEMVVGAASVWLLIVPTVQVHPDPQVHQALMRGVSVERLTALLELPPWSMQWSAAAKLGVRQQKLVETLVRTHEAKLVRAAGIPNDWLVPGCKIGGNQFVGPPVEDEAAVQLDELYRNA